MTETPETLTDALEKFVQSQTDALGNFPGIVSDHVAVWKADRAERDALGEALAAVLAYHANNTGLNMEWRKAALAHLPKGWAEREWPLLIFLASLPPEKRSSPKPPAPEPQVLTTGWPPEKRR